jgi:preprotein translocase subunit Sec63
VIEVLRAVGGGPGAEPTNEAADVAALDEEAVRERVRARLQLVEDGDYFALLGVAPDVTGYEVRRAFLELRRAFDPARILTPEVVDLADDLRKIVSILEEAYEILKDAARRERYRRAIGAVPGL